MTNDEIKQTILSTSIEISAIKGWTIFHEARYGRSEGPSKDIMDRIYESAQIMAEALMITEDLETDEVSGPDEYDYEAVRELLAKNPDATLRDILKFIYTQDEDFRHYLDSIVAEGVDAIYYDILIPLIQEAINEENNDTPNLVA